MSSSILASMSVVLQAQTDKFAAGMKSAGSSLTQFKNNADRLKGIDLSKMAPDFSGMVTPIAKLQSEARKLETAIRTATNEKDIKAFNQQLEKTQAEMARIRNLGKSGFASFNTGAMGAAGQMKNLAGSAGTVNMELARIIQDAPFGMMGIGNNIQQLTANFGQLRAQAGSTGAALSATLAGLLTPASALTLGIAALTSGWVMYEKWQQASNKSAGVAAAALSSLKKTTEEYITSLDGVNRARLNGDRDAQKELTGLRLLYTQTQDLTKSLTLRKQAVDAIQKQYPEYFKGLTDEEILAGKAEAAYKKLSGSILATARARAAQDIIAEEARKVLLNEQKIIDLNIQKLQTEKKARKELAEASKRASNVAYGQGGSLGPVLTQRKNEEAINEIIQARQKLDRENAASRNLILRLEKDITNATLLTNEATAEQAVKLGVLGEAMAKLKALEEERPAASKERLAIINREIVDVQILIDKYNQLGLARKGPVIEPIKPKDPKIENSDEDPADNIFRQAAAFKALPAAIAPASAAMVKFFEDQAAAASGMKDFTDGLVGMADSMASSVSSTMASFAAGIGAGTQSLSSFGDVLLKAMADLGRIAGEYFLKLGLPMAISGNPIGFALMAAGASLAAFSGLMASSAGGGGSLAPSIGSSVGGGYKQPNYNPSGSFKHQIEIVGRLEGRDLVWIQKQEEYRTRRTTG